MKKIILLFFISSIISQEIPSFNSKRAMDLLELQCSFGPRFPGSPGHEKTKEFLQNFLTPISDSLFVFHEKVPHPSKKNIMHLTNYFARYNLDSKTRIMLMAHWDTREFADQDPNPNNRKLPVLGANDGASGVAILLTLAEILHSTPLLNVGVDLLFIDGEDQGNRKDPDSYGLGTQAFAKNIPNPKPEFAICIDMVADHNQHFPIEYFSLQQAPDIVHEVWTLANKLGYNQFENKQGLAIMDDHYYLYKYAQIPAIDIIDFNYPNTEINYWHTLQDIPENCSVESLGVVGIVMTNFLYIRDQN